MRSTPQLADFDAAIAWVEHDDGGFVPARAEVIALDHVARVYGGAAVQPLAAPYAFDPRFVFMHWVRTRAARSSWSAPCRPEIENPSNSERTLASRRAGCSRRVR
jgi:hypothetical protein